VAVYLASQVKYWEDTFASKGVTLHVPTLCPVGEYTITTALENLTAFIDGACRCICPRSWCRYPPGRAAGTC
jgi:hypothetical protein